MKSHELLDQWHATGDQYDDFRKRILDITENTYTIPLRTSEMQLMSVITEESSDERIALRVYTAAQCLTRKSPSVSNLSIEKCREKNMPDEFLEEIQQRAKLMLRLEDGHTRVLFTSNFLCRDLAARAKLAGDAIYEPSEERDAYIMSRYVRKPCEAFAVVRKSNHVSTGLFHKVFALPSGNYCYIPQTTVLDIVDELETILGKKICEYWEMDHNLTRVWLSFPDKAKDISDVYGLPDPLIPGVLLETSDTGDCSLRVVATWKKASGARPMIGVYQREHRGKFDCSAALDSIKNDLIPMYTKLPERLCELMTIDLKDPAAAIEKTISMLGVAKQLGRRATESLSESLREELPVGVKMTGYDMAMLFMDLPCRYAGEARHKDFFEKAAGRVAFLDFDKIASATSAVVLTPAS